eukprot:2216577-Amphidinium_carterae.1
MVCECDASNSSNISLRDLQLIGNTAACLSGAFSKSTGRILDMYPMRSTLDSTGSVCRRQQCSPLKVQQQDSVAVHRNLADIDLLDCLAAVHPMQMSMY